MPKTKRHSVLLICGTNVKSTVTATVERYAAARKWYLHMHADGFYDLDIRDGIKMWKVGGVIIESGHLPKDFSTAPFRGIPVVHVCPAYVGLRPRYSVNFDNTACGTLAVRELARLTPAAFAFIGSLERNPWSDGRRLGFLQALRRTGNTRPVFVMKEIPRTTAAIGNFLKTVPKPCGVFAVHDIRAQQVVESCAKLGLRVPEDIAVIGVDNDTLLCESTSPTLSSIPCDPANITASLGWKAADLLETLMRGRTTPPRCNLLVSPDMVVRRMSTTEHIAFSAPVRAALEFIRVNACSGINVMDVVKASGISCPILYRRFKENLGRTIDDEIHRVQIEAVKELLRTPHLRIHDLPARTGFNSLTALQAAFKRMTGTTMRAWRTT